MDRGDCVVLIFVKNFGDPGANGKDLTGAGGFELEISNEYFLYGSQVLNETVRFSLVKSAIHIYTVILFSLLSRQPSVSVDLESSCYILWQLSTSTFVMCSENQGCNLSSILKEPLAVPNSHKNISIINGIQKLQVSDKP